MTHNFYRSGKRLLTKHMKIGFDSFYGLFSMDSRYRGNDHGFEAFLLEHFLVGFIKSNTVGLQVLLCPLSFALVRGAGCYERRTGSAVEEVKGMPFTHAAEACACDFELLGCHFLNGRDAEMGLGFRELFGRYL